MLARSLFLDRGHRAVGVHMTGTCAVAKFVRRVEHLARRLPLHVRALYEVICVTPGTIRLECRELPWDLLCVTGMAIQAADGRCVLSKTGACVAVVYWCPARGEMTLITLQIGHEMIVRFALRNGIVVTCRALSADDGVIYLSRRPGVRCMAQIALTCSDHVISIFTRSNRSVVTRETGTGDIGMIKAHRAPVGRDVAVLAGVRGLQVSGRLAGGNRPVVT